MVAAVHISDDAQQTDKATPASGHSLANADGGTGAYVIGRTRST